MNNNDLFSPVVFSCYGETSVPVGWFTNPEYPLPNTDRLSCALTVNKTSQDIKQIRLDFASFEVFILIYPNFELQKHIRKCYMICKSI